MATKPASSFPLMPNASEWANVEVKAPTILATEPHGRVVGIDYEEWAVAWEDARQKPERLIGRARSLEAKGFKELAGQSLSAHGVDSPIRVWVMPRKLYEQRRRVRDQTLVDRVAAGLYPDSALSAGYTRATKK